METLHKLALVFIILFSPFVLQAQEHDILRYLKDGGISRSKNLIKIEPLKIHEGNLQIIYERYLAERWSLEMGAGVLMGYYNQPIPWNWISKIEKEDCTLDKPNTGFSLMLAPRFYKDEWSESIYWALPVNYRFYPGQIHLMDFAVAFGWQKIFDNGILIDISAGLGMKFQSSIDQKSYTFDASSRNDNSELINSMPPGTTLDIDESFPDKVRAHVPLSIKIGYRFKSR